MQRHVGVDGIGVQALPQHQRRFLMLISSLGQKRNVGGQRHVAGNFLPYELKSVGGEPHILAAAADGVGSLRSVVVDRARVQNCAHIGVPLKTSDGC